MLRLLGEDLDDWRVAHKQVSFALYFLFVRGHGLLQTVR